MFSQKEFLTFPKGAVLKFAIAVLAVIGLPLVLTGSSTSVLAQVRESTMEQRLNDNLRQLAEAKGCDTERTSVQLLLDAVLANNVPVSKETGPIINEAIARTSQELAKYAQQQGRCAEVQGTALDVKYLLDQVSEVARAVLPIVEQCREGARIDKEPCSHLQRLLDEEGGREVFEPPPPTSPPTNIIIKPGFSVKLRGPFVPPYIREMKEDVRVTNPIGPGLCVVVFKETRGLMLRLIFVRMTVVADPWATPQLLRGTLVPVWALQWVPSEYVKEWNICNVAGTIKKTVTQRVVQDVPLNYFWRFYPKDP
ncbi:MAG TPA: hypothetical protein VHE60_10335 [Pyrinomonadaceae bacterium]|nr:hypothetical protein [Pyrinomonadaceae bacterium]